MKKKLLVFALILSFIVTLFTTNLTRVDVKAADGTVTISVSKSNVSVGETIDVTVNLSYSKTFAAAQLQLLYDNSVMSCSEGADGVIALEFMEMTYPSSFDWKYSFIANQTGVCNFSVKGIVFIDLDGNPFSPSLGSASVKVMAPGSDDATLSSLQIGGVQIYVDNGSWDAPGFRKDVTAYITAVDNGVTSVNVSATSSQTDGRIEISGEPSNLQVGNNIIVIKSYAPNGNSINYQVNVVRRAPEPVTEAPTNPPTEAPTAPPVTEPVVTEPVETEPTTTETPTEAPKDIDITIDGKKYTIVSDLSSEKIPSGFYMDVDTFNGKDVIDVKNDRVNITLFCLKDEDGNTAFYIYDDNNFYKYTSISTPTGTYFIYDSRKASTKPSGEEVEIEVKGNTIKGFVNPENDEFVYFYAKNQKMEFNWYSYDTVEDTIQRASAVFAENNNEETSSSDEKVTSDETKKPSETKQSTDKEGGISFKTNDILLIAVVVLALIVIIMIVIICVKLRKKDSEDEEDDFDEPEIAITKEKPVAPVTKEPVEKVTEADVQDFIKEAENLNKDNK